LIGSAISKLLKSKLIGYLGKYGTVTCIGLGLYIDWTEYNQKNEPYGILGV
jgi:hypothetical protein